MLGVDSSIDSTSLTDSAVVRPRRPPSRVTALDESQRTWLRHRLHDELAQYLAFALIQIDIAREGPPAKRAQALMNVRNLVHESLQIARDTLQGVEGVAVNDALHLRLQNAVAEVTGMSGSRIEIQCPPVAQLLPESVAFTLVRAARELLINACKHASGARIRLRVVEEKGCGLTLWVSDDGPGVPPSARDDELRHFGLRRLPEQLAASDVKLSMRSMPEHGLSVRLQWRPRPQSAGTAEQRSCGTGEVLR